MFHGSIAADIRRYGYFLRFTPSASSNFS